ncbi:hypothetical protein D3C80_1659490 [compost metagenome]
MIQLEQFFIAIGVAASGAAMSELMTLLLLLQQLEHSVASSLDSVSEHCSMMPKSIHRNYCCWLLF